MLKKTAAIALLATTFNSYGGDTLGYNERLYRGQQLTSQNGQYSLIMRDDGVLALYDLSGKLRWSANKNYENCDIGYYATLDYSLYIKSLKRTDSNNSATCIRWYPNPGPRMETYTKDSPKNTYLRVQDDGNIVITTIKPLWFTHTAGEILPNSNDLKFPPGTRFTPGSTYDVGFYKYTLQTDGNFVIYKRGVAIWNTGTQGKSVHRAEFQEDGNFVIYDVNNKPLWFSRTQGNLGAYLAFQSDGNMVIYKPTPVWALWGVTLKDYSAPPKKAKYIGKEITFPIWEWKF